MNMDKEPRLGEESQERGGGDDGVQNWVEGRTMDRRAQEIKDSMCMEGGVMRTPSNKRIGEESRPSSSKKSKLKYPLLAID